MSIVAWIVLGLVAGFISSKIVNHKGEGVLLDGALGVVGALIGGFLMRAVGGTGITGFNLWSLVVATGGAIVVLLVAHAIQGRQHLTH